MGDRHTGYWANAVVFSFTCGKSLFAGEGGMIVTPHREFFHRLVWETQHPLRQLRDVPDLPPNELALNLRINSLAAVWADAALSALASSRSQL
jgi:perosamine synthetase